VEEVAASSSKYVRRGRKCNIEVYFGWFCVSFRNKSDRSSVVSSKNRSKNQTPAFSERNTKRGRQSGSQHSFFRLPGSGQAQRTSRRYFALVTSSAMQHYKASARAKVTAEGSVGGCERRNAKLNNTNCIQQGIYNERKAAARGVPPSRGGCSRSKFFCAPGPAVPMSLAYQGRNLRFLPATYTILRCRVGPRVTARPMVCSASSEEMQPLGDGRGSRRRMRGRVDVVERERSSERSHAGRERITSSYSFIGP
jgi:hypothetical protein